MDDAPDPGGRGPGQALHRRRPAHRRRCDGVSFAIRPGVVTGLIGPDGAGKTTLMRLAAGLLVPDAGRIRVLGMDATRESLAVQAALGYMPQRFGLYEDLTRAGEPRPLRRSAGRAQDGARRALRRTDAHDRAGAVHAAAWPGGCPAA